MTYHPVDVVEVRAWDALVGAVALDPTTNFYAFEYAGEWLSRGVELAPLHLPVREGIFVFPELSPKTFHRLPALLADSLPDRFGNALVDAWMEDNGVSKEAVTPLDRLAYAADRATGALTFRPPAGPDAEVLTAVQLADLVTAARAQVSGKVGDAPDAHEALRQLIVVGTSAGGARAKAVIAYNPTTGQIRSGQLDMPEGFEPWLIKLDGVTGDLTRETDPFTGGGPYGLIEYAYYLMATAAGVNMSQSRLLPEGPRTHFLTRRFDRTVGNERIHMQSLCAMAHLDFNLVGTHSYGTYLRMVRDLGMTDDELQQAFRRIVFNVAAVNRDDHTKNLAFLLAEGGRWQLSPAYDLTHAHNPSGQWTSNHQMGVNGKFDGIAQDDLSVLADRYQVANYRRIMQEVLETVGEWPDFAAQAGVPREVTQSIQADLAKNTPR